MYDARYDARYAHVPVAAPQPQRSGCLWYCLRSMATVVVGFICLQSFASMRQKVVIAVVVAMLVVMLGLFGDGINGEFERIQRSLEAQPRPVGTHSVVIPSRLF